VAEEGNPELKLRVFVQGGGCSGFQYGFTFDEVVNEDDTQMSKNGVTLLIDAMSLQYLVRRRDRLQGRPAGRAVRDQEPERHHHLRLRVVVLGLIAGPSVGSRRRPRPARGAPAPRSRRADCRFAARRRRPARQRPGLDLVRRHASGGGGLHVHCPAAAGQRAIRCG
jgi:hypothetical protein